MKVEESKKKDNDFWNELSNKEKEKVNISLKQIKEGKVKPYDEVKEIAQKALKKLE